MKVNINPPSPATKSAMILTLPPPPLPGLQNDKGIQYSEDTKLKV